MTTQTEPAEFSILHPDHASACEALSRPWSSPYYRLATREFMAQESCEAGAGCIDSSQLCACVPFQGLAIEIIRSCALSQKSQLSFDEQDMPVLFSLRLAGTGSICLHERTRVLHQASRQLTIGYFPACRGTVTFQAASNTLVNVMTTRSLFRKFLPECSSYLYNFFNLDEQDGYVLRLLPASTGLMVAANQLLSPSVSPRTRSLFVTGAAMEFLSLAIDNLCSYIDHGKIIRLDKKDISVLEKVREYLERNMTNPPSIEELCRKFYINSFKLKKGSNESVKYIV